MLTDRSPCCAGSECHRRALWNREVFSVLLASPFLPVSTSMPRSYKYLFSSFGNSNLAVIVSWLLFTVSSAAAPGHCLPRWPAHGHRGPIKYDNPDYMRSSTVGIMWLRRPTQTNATKGAWKSLPSHDVKADIDVFRDKGCSYWKSPRGNSQ